MRIDDCTTKDVIRTRINNIIEFHLLPLQFLVLFYQYYFDHHYTCVYSICTSSTQKQNMIVLEGIFMVWASLAFKPFIKIFCFYITENHK